QHNPLMSRMKLICFLLLGAVGLGALDLVASLVDDQFVYSGFAGAGLTLDGSATVTPSGLLELTNGSLQLKGHAFHPTPLRFRELPNGTVRSFAASFVFGILSAYPDMSAHGIVFVVAPTTDFSTALASQYLGLVNVQNNGHESNRIFAVELDTLQQDEFRDINDNHVGVDINGLVSLQSSNAGYYVGGDKERFENLTLISHEAMQVWIDYDAGTNRINVALAPLGVAKPARPLMSATYNLSSVITSTAYVGFSSATGSFDSRHYVLGCSFRMGSTTAPAMDIAKLPTLPREIPKVRSKVLQIVLPITSAAVVLALGTVVVLLLRRRRRYTELREDWEVEFGPHRFPFKDLHHATQGFNSKNLLGVGGFGRVYRGVLPDCNMEIAVKRVSHDSRQGVKEFIAEVVSLGRLQHCNLVRLLGYCRRKGELLLVYEHMPNGSLDKHLYGHQDDKPTLNWAQRFQIIKGIASGLLYLHEEWERVVVHRDIKASNVLLDDKMNGRLGDFGLARLYDHGTDPQSTHVVGTIGYIAPELGRTSKASPLTDVFAFGTFLLEVTCGRRPIFQDPRGNQVMLVDWVLEHWRRESLADAVDTKLRGDYNIDEACLVLQLGLSCSHPFVNARPNMRQVMQYLSNEVPLPQLMSTKMSFHTLAMMQNEGFDSYIQSSYSFSKMSENSHFDEGPLDLHPTA
uniref:non-specific serine/threonine protein kinase n=1 Tax=Aegilops tauschii subsp. strangulata TaxID=200361 RepID=A0A453NZ91_AEGTS